MSEVILQVKDGNMGIRIHPVKKMIEYFCSKHQLYFFRLSCPICKEEKEIR